MVWFQSEGVYVDNNGNVFIVETSINQIQKFNSSGQLLLKWGKKGQVNGSFNSPSRICGDNLGNIYITDDGNNRIQKFNSEGKFLTKWGREGTSMGALGVIMKRVNLIFALIVWVMSMLLIIGIIESRSLTQLGSLFSNGEQKAATNGSFYKPSAICVDNDNNIYVADSGRIQKFSPDGTFIFTFCSSGMEMVRLYGLLEYVLIAMIISMFRIAIEYKSLVLMVHSF
jgi:DNA-binding beta-propeller fold protein YncE